MGRIKQIIIHFQNIKFYLLTFLNFIYLFPLSALLLLYIHISIQARQDVAWKHYIKFFKSSDNCYLSWQNYALLFLLTTEVSYHS